MKNQPTSGNSATSPASRSAAPDADLLTSEELATVLRISIRTLRRWERDGMPTQRRHRIARYSLPQIREWMKAGGRSEGK